MPYYSMLFNGILSIPVLDDSDEEKKERIKKYESSVRNFAKKLVGSFDEKLENRFKIIFKVVVGGGYLGDHLRVSLVMERHVITGYISKDELSFWDKQFCVLDEVYLCVEQEIDNNEMESIAKRFGSILALTKSYNESIKNLYIEK